MQRECKHCRRFVTPVVLSEAGPKPEQSVPTPDLFSVED